MTIQPKLVTQKAAAEMMGMTPHRLSWLVKARKIRAIDVSAGKYPEYMFALEDIDRFLQGFPPYISTEEPESVSSVKPERPKPISAFKDSEGRFTPEQIAKLTKGGLK